jgi:hypothetical protein
MDLAKFRNKSHFLKKDILCTILGMMTHIPLYANVFLGWLAKERNFHQLT